MRKIHRRLPGLQWRKRDQGRTHTQRTEPARRYSFRPLLAQSGRSQRLGRCLLLTQSGNRTQDSTSDPEGKIAFAAAVQLNCKCIVLASPTTAAIIRRAAKAQVRAASARELASDHSCLGMTSPVATVTRNSASISSMRPARWATKSQIVSQLILMADRGIRATGVFGNS